MRRLAALILTTATATAVAGCDADRRGADEPQPADTTATAAADLQSIADIGLMTPESVLYDDQLDMYLVSNINGEPTSRDGNGFIARLTPRGGVQELKWIDGEADGVTLHAPKGMAFRGDTLYVSDIDTVRAFHRRTGVPLGAWGVPNASFLNDIAAGDDGIYVTDTGVDATFAPIGTDAVYRIGADGVTTVSSGRALLQPNGIVLDGGNILMVPFGGNGLFSIPIGGGAPTRFASLPAGQLDGLVRLDDGSLLVSSWEGRAVYRVSSSGAVTTAVENVEAPADIGWDSRRNRLLIPLFMANRIEVREIR
jgi:hypothetical protein